MAEKLCANLVHFDAETQSGISTYLERAEGRTVRVDTVGLQYEQSLKLEVVDALVDLVIGQIVLAPNVRDLSFTRTGRPGVGGGAISLFTTQRGSASQLERDRNLIIGATNQRLQLLQSPFRFPPVR